jgi:hypothetical protein
LKKNLKAWLKDIKDEVTDEQLNGDGENDDEESDSDDDDE